MEKKYIRSFTGPLFILGMPRSGTKLLRQLLTEHPMVSITPVETEFLPYWDKHWRTFGDLSKHIMFKKFYKRMLRLPYFIFMYEESKLIEENVWFELCNNFTPSGVFEALIRHDSGVDYGSERIWGDKSPAYIRHIRTLKSLFLKAKFIHIIRDVRDYCLSINRAWGKNIIRATQRWTDDIQKCREDSRNFRVDYMELKFEDLLENPESELQKICRFLDLTFERDMLSLSRPVENIGDAKGRVEIVRNNREKYLLMLNLSLRRKIERIAAPVLRACGYTVDYSGEPIKISRRQMLFYQFLDALSLIKSEMGKRGFFGSLSFHLWHFITSGNRNF